MHYVFGSQAFILQPPFPKHIKAGDIDRNPRDLSDGFGRTREMNVTIQGCDSYVT